MSESRNFRWYMDRLRAMDAGEIGLRVREKVRQRADRLTISRMTSNPLRCGPVSEFPELPERTGISEMMREGIRADSENILAGKWQILDGTMLSLDMPPHWHRDYLGGGACESQAVSYQINHRKLDANCDPRMVWETSRFVQLVRLAQRAWLDKDPRYSDAVSELLRHWHEHNPLGRGINWTSPMEAGIRLINLVWTDALLSAGFAEWDDQRDDKRGVIEEMVAQHVWWTWRNRSFGSSANNHLLGELCGLTLAVARWPELARHAASVEVLAGLVWDEMLRQFAADGGNREEALHYHLFAWELCWQVTLAARACGLVPNQQVTDRLERAGTFFADLVAPEEPWDFGDSDNAHVTPVYSDQNTSLSEWQAWFRHQEGGNGIAAWLGTAPKAAGKMSTSDHWTVFEESGYAAFSGSSLFARMDFSGLGLEPMAAHGHLDALHLSLWHDGAAIVIDPGTGAYFSDADARSYLASAEAHNAPVFLDREGYPQRRGPFLWSGAHDKPRLISKVETSLTAVLQLGDRKITRQVAFATGRSMKVTDKLSGPGDFQILWQFAPQARLIEDGIVSYGDVQLHIAVESDIAIEQLQVSGAATRTGPGFCAPSFRQYAAAPCLIVRGCSEGAATIKTTFRIESLKSGS